MLQDAQEQMETSRTKKRSDYSKLNSMAKFTGLYLMTFLLQRTKGLGFVAGGFCFRVGFGFWWCVGFFISPNSEQLALFSVFKY